MAERGLCPIGLAATLHGGAMALSAQPCSNAAWLNRPRMGSGALRLLSPHMNHILRASRAQVTLLKFMHVLHRGAEYAPWTITLQNDVIALNENFDRIPFVHLISFAQRFGKHNAPQLIYLTYYTCRFHCIHHSCVKYRESVWENLRVP